MDNSHYCRVSHVQYTLALSDTDSSLHPHGEFLTTLQISYNLTDDHLPFLV